VIEQADAVVIGGGILGASVAHFLTRLEYGQVVLVEKSRICGGSTQYSAAHVRQHYTNEVAIRLAVRAVEMFENDEEELGGPTGFTRLGYLVLAPPGQEQALIDVVPFQRSLGVETGIVSVDDVAARYPELDLDGVALGCYETTAGYADPVLTVQSLVRSAERRGLKVYEGCRVIGIATARGKATGVITGEGEISAPVVVNATGPWGDRTGRMVGIEYPLELSREHEAHFDVPDCFGDLPVVGDLLFNHNLMVYAAYLLVPLVWLVLNRTTWGLKIKSAGQNPAAGWGCTDQPAARSRRPASPRADPRPGRAG